MNYLQRTLDLKAVLAQKSCFLLGPRGTVKSSLIKHTLGNAVVINLLRTEYQMRLTREPNALQGLIESEQKDRNQLIVIDEIQKIPILLDEVHRLIEDEGRRFLLTGSSARRLKQHSVNLLGGRARRAELFPLTSQETPKFNLERYLRFGGLPSVWLGEEPEEDLDAYISNYINEEIKAEGAIRKIPPFIEFLRFAALTNGQVLNFSKIANDAGVSAPTIASYYKILEDTLIGSTLLPWKKSTHRKAISTAKFYLFDTGVTNTLAGTKTLDRNSDLFGKLFEQWIFMEIKAYLSYKRIKEPLNFWRTEDKIEVDFLVGDALGIECKASSKTNDRDAIGLECLREEGKIKRFLLVSNDPVNRSKNKVEYLHWEKFLDGLWSGKFV